MNIHQALTSGKRFLRFELGELSSVIRNISKLPHSYKYQIVKLSSWLFHVQVERDPVVLGLKCILSPCWATMFHQMSHLHFQSFPVASWASPISCEFRTFHVQHTMMSYFLEGNCIIFIHDQLITVAKEKCKRQVVDQILKLDFICYFTKHSSYRWSLAIHLCGYQGLSLCRWERAAEIAELQAKNFKIASFEEVLINTNCSPCFIMCHGRTIRMKKWSWTLGTWLG